MPELYIKNPGTSIVPEVLKHKFLNALDVDLYNKRVILPLLKGDMLFFPDRGVYYPLRDDMAKDVFISSLKECFGENIIADMGGVEGIIAILSYQNDNALNSLKRIIRHPNFIEKQGQYVCVKDAMSKLLDGVNKSLAGTEGLTLDGEVLVLYSQLAVIKTEVQEALGVYEIFLNKNQSILDLVTNSPMVIQKLESLANEYEGVVKLLQNYNAISTGIDIDKSVMDEYIALIERSRASLAQFDEDLGEEEHFKLQEIWRNYNIGDLSNNEEKVKLSEQDLDRSILYKSLVTKWSRFAKKFELSRLKNDAALNATYEGELKDNINFQAIVATPLNYVARMLPDSLKLDYPLTISLTTGSRSAYTDDTKTIRVPKYMFGSMDVFNANFGHIEVEQLYYSLLLGTLAHEIGHFIEYKNENVHKFCQCFLLRNTQFPLHLLNKAYPNKGYKRDEVCRSGHNFSEYIGKAYPDGHTEVMSEGFEEYVTNPCHLWIYSEELFLFIHGLCNNL